MSGQKSYETKFMMKKILLLLSCTAFISFGQDLYDIDNITVFEIEFAETNWDEILDTYYANDLDEKLVGTVTINGNTYDSVGVKYKGNSSYSETNAKNPLNIDLDYLYDQKFQGYKTFKLSNVFRDPSGVREVLGYEIARNYMDVPLSNYAKVYVNGTYLGLYTSSEGINGDYIERRLYGDKDNTRVKCNPDYGSGGSPNLKYMGLDSSLYYTSYEVKSDYGWGDLVELCQVLFNDVNSVDTILDIDRALWMLAYNNVFSNLDSYTGPLRQNYYLLQDDNRRMCPIIWDLNQDFGSFSMVDGFGGGSGPPSITDLTEMDPYLREGDTDWPLIQQLFTVPRYRKMYMAHFRTLYEENLEDGSYYTRAQELQDIIDAEVSSDPNYFYSYAEFVMNLDDQVGSPGPGGGQTYGVAQVLDGRKTYLSTYPDLSLTQPTITPIDPSPLMAYAGDMITFTATIINVDYAYLGWRDYKGDVFSKVDMFDDGLHGDGAAGDDVWGAQITIGASDIQYYFYAENADASIFSPVRAEHEFYNLTLSQEVVINEIMPRNWNTASDQDNEYDDWVELYNNTASEVDLSGYHLSDDPLNPGMWTFPNGATIAANDYLIVWLDKDTLQVGLHANFKLSGGGETVVFSDNMLNPINEVTYPEIEYSSTFGRYPNGTGPFIRMIPTYNSENSYSSIGIEEEVVQLGDVILYPNPVVDQLTIAVDDIEEPLDFQIYDLQGKMITNGIIQSRTDLDLSSWESGLYLVHFPKLNQSHKIIKR